MKIIDVVTDHWFEKRVNLAKLFFAWAEFKNDAVINDLKCLLKMHLNQ